MDTTVELLDCGSLAAPLSMFEAGGADARVELPVPAWLIRHRGQTAVIDCGMHEELTRPGELLDLVSLFFDLDVDPQRLIAAQLEARDVDPAAVDLVVLTHLHFDHVGGLAQLPNARVVVQEPEWRAGMDDELAALNTFRREDYDLGHEVMTLDGEHDLFGDGVVTCLPTPGHSPGHQSVRVRLADQEIVICADCAYFGRTLTGGALPPGSFDRAQHEASIERLASLGRAGATLIPGHDAAAFATLPARLA